MGTNSAKTTDIYNPNAPLSKAQELRLLQFISE